MFLIPYFVSIFERVVTLIFIAKSYPILYEKFAFPLAKNLNATILKGLGDLTTNFLDNFTVAHTSA